MFGTGVISFFAEAIDLKSMEGEGQLCTEQVEVEFEVETRSGSETI